MTHRERVLWTFRFERTDHSANDLMAGTVRPELLQHFHDRHLCDDAVDVLEFLDTDFRWMGMVAHAPQSAPSAR